MTNNIENLKISTAVILAAGKSIRLLPITKNLPKCLIEVNGIPILVQLIDTLNKYGFSKIIIVVGYFSDKIIKIVKETDRWKNIKVEFVINELYASTNNIYSLWLTRNLINTPLLIIESDIIFDSSLLEEILIPDRMALADYTPTMTGTTVKINNFGIVNKMNVGGNVKDTLEISIDRSEDIKKTVNIYSLSLESWKLTKVELDKKINKEMLQDFYEIVFSKLIAERKITFRGVLFDYGKWFEIDTLNDLQNAERLYLVEKIISKH